MAIAVSVLLFLIGAFWLVCVFGERGGLAFLAAAATIAAGVLQLALPLQGIHIGVGVLLCIYAVATFALFIKIVSQGTSGSGAGLVIALSFASFLLFAWVTTFAVLQLTIVV